MPTCSPPGGVRAWMMWFIGALAFAATLFSRTSFGASGAYAIERFGVGTGLLSIFIVVQMVVYALMQIPAGAVLDRLGARTSLATGFIIIMLGQVALAFTDDLFLGIAERAVIAVGDSIIWMSAIRVIPEWFPPHRAPVLTQLSYVLGQAGQWASAVPFIALLAGPGWTTAFLVIAATCAAMVVIDLLCVWDTPSRRNLRGVVASADSGSGVVAVLRNPGAQLGYFMHMATATSPLVFTLMWGYSYLEQGQGMSKAAAGNLFSVYVFSAILWAPLIGVLSNRWRHHRVQLALGFSMMLAAVWVVILALPGSAPIWLLTILMIVMGSGFPASNISFDINRTYVPMRDTGKGSGMVVMGGFSMGMILVALVGVLAEALGGGPGAWRIAMATQIVGWVFSWLMIWRLNAKVRRQLGDVEPS